MKKITTFLKSKSLLLAFCLCAGNILLQPFALKAAMQAPIPAVAQEPETLDSSPQNIDFEVRALGNRRFMVNFINKDARVHIRIYDVIGNLIKEDFTTQRGRFSQEYDMSKSKSEVYIVEVGDTKYSTTKRIFLN